uniref:Uncharacterized protein n=1 Tax=Arundo donax TaxID=35708 RepID=A0A0A8ZCJ0_ARUDO
MWSRPPKQLRCVYAIFMLLGCICWTVSRKQDYTFLFHVFQTFKLLIQRMYIERHKKIWSRQAKNIPSKKVTMHEKLNIFLFCCILLPQM